MSYFIGSDPAQWRRDVPVWGGVRYVDLYPGIDLEVSGAGGRVSQRLVVRGSEGATSLGQVRLRVEGSDALAVEGDGVQVRTALGEYALPLLEVEGAAVGNLRASVVGGEIAAPFAPASTGAAAVTTETAITCTTLLYATFLGGFGYDYGYGITVDSAGCVYVTGSTDSTDFPAANGPGYDTSYNGGYASNRGDAFVVKLSADGTRLDYATFLGGSIRDEAYGIAVDGAGQAYVVGDTQSLDFPAASGSGYDTSFNGGSDAFVFKLSADGTALDYATLIGGSDYDYGRGIAVDGAGHAYITGYTYSANFPAKDGPGYDTSSNGDKDAFVVKLSADGTALDYATFLGGSGRDEGYGIAVDGEGHAYVIGNTGPDFPAANGPGYDTSYNGDQEAFVVKLSADGLRLDYATFLGGRSTEYGYGITVDSAGHAYVTGSTASENFPAASGPGYDTTYNGSRGSDAFVVKLSADGMRLDYATFLGGSLGDGCHGIAVDGVGHAYVIGNTESLDFPAVNGPGYDTSYTGYGSDAFMIKLNAAGTALDYATFLGGDSTDHGSGIAVDGTERAYITGHTISGNFPAASGPGYDTSYNNFGDAWVVKLATVAEDACGLSLQPGWNLVSLPNVPGDTNPATVLASIEGKYDLVYAYDATDTADPWKQYSPAPGSSNDLTAIDETMGLWIHATEAVTLSAFGAAPVSSTISLKAGWNLVGYPSQTARPVADALASIAGKYDQVYAYEAADTADPWKHANTAMPAVLNDLTQMAPGKGYWIHVTEDCTWTVP